MKQHFSILLSLICVYCVNANAQCSLPAPATINFTNVASCQLTVTWGSVTGASNYSVQYRISSDLSWTILPNVGGTVNSYTISGLNSGKLYKIKVAAVCANGAMGHFRQSSKKTTKCSTPSAVTVSGIGTDSATISWTALCATSQFTLQYKLHTQSQWTTVSNIFGNTYILNGLSLQSSYDIQVKSTCGGGNSSYSPIVTFNTQAIVTPHKGKNVLFILLDDSRQDPFTPDGGPAFFLDPNITRIANEGVRFKFCFPAESQCAPSRASIYTGLYPHKTGVLNNKTIVPITTTTLAEILHNNNYYVGMVGKYQLTSDKQPGYDYWMENHLTDYINADWTVNDTTKTIIGHKTDVATDSAIGFLHKVPSDKSFYLEVAYAAPHIPYIPRPVDDSLYSNDIMPMPGNPNSYSQNYPSFLYPCQQGLSKETNAIRGFYRMLAGIEYSVGRLLNELTAMNILDSTLIIFTSDNGYLLGEHGLDSKRLAYEESIHLPLYIRYPPMITAGTVINNEIAMNIDLPPTILDYLGITDTTAMDGISLKKMIEGTAHRNEFFYEFFNEDCTPDIRCVRSFDYKFIQYGCNVVTEEFFDLNNDPEENTNQVNNSAYDSLVEVYRAKLIYWEDYYQYTSPGNNMNCHISNPAYQKIQSDDGEEEAPIFEVLPNPVSDVITINFYSNENLPYHLQLYNGIGQLTYDEHGEASALRKKLDARSLPVGSYMAMLQHGDQVFEKKLLIQR